ncbi:MAG: amino acid permease [Pyrinomonadaceae bacterium MAG19_C2-C3]|nr:amino acid permease [Pyrinomonadaceae bacterium MAG19_C2-C3]
MDYTKLFRRKSIALIQRDAALGYSDHGDAAPEGGGLRRALGVVDLTALGIAAIIGASIFSMIGTASYNGGPAVVFLFMFTAVACAFSALCYAQFASAIPIAGSAYTYAYASFGELIAWIIGWDLLIEYAIGNIAVAISWSDYFTSLLEGIKLPALGLKDGIIIPSYLTMDFLTASRAFSGMEAAAAEQISSLLAQGNTLETISRVTEIKRTTVDAYAAWANAPRVGGFPIICDLPALVIVVLITALVFIGIRESKRVSNVMVALKLATILLVIILGAFYVRLENWSPFAPNGVSGVLKGVAAVFFAYIGFDALSTTAEECKNPQRDLPRAMMFSLVLCTFLYILIALVLTGMVSYEQLQVGDPLAYVFGAEGANIPWVAGVIAVSAVIALATVLLVFQLGQPRIWMAMSRDGLLPPIFSSIHPRFRTPWFSTLVTGFFVAVPALFMNLTEVTDLAVIGTLFAFVLVCGGVLVLDRKSEQEGQAKGRFRVPYINSRYVVPALIVVVIGSLLYFNPNALSDLFRTVDPADSTIAGWDYVKHKIPLYGYIVLVAVMAYNCVRYRLSLIPVLGLLSCAYLMTELGITNWTRFLIWLGVGLIVYLLYGYRHSKLGKRVDETNGEELKH